MTLFTRQLTIKTKYEINLVCIVLSCQRSFELVRYMNYQPSQPSYSCIYLLLLFKFNYCALYSRNSPISERKRDDRSRSKSNPPGGKRIPIWETDKDPSPQPYRHKQPETGESSFYNRRRYTDNTDGYRDRRNDDREQNYYQNRHDRYQNSEHGRNYDNHDSYNRHDSYDSKFDHDRYQGPSWRRPNFQGGSNRSRNFKSSEQNYGDGPSSRYRDEESESSSNSKGKIKLVDY